MTIDNAWEARLNNYIATRWRSVEGWAGTLVVGVLPKVIQSFHDAHRITGGVAEIGVHHGKFFFALDALRRSGEKGFVADLFEQQDQNIDKSGKGDRGIFEENLRQISHDAEAITFYQGDSLDSQLKRSIAADGHRIRVFSVDGGHTPQHAINDLELAASTLVNGGVVILDDFCNIGWPGVTEGVLEYLKGYPPIVPVMSISGKLVLISLGYADQFRAHVRSSPYLKGCTIRKTVVGGHDVPWAFKKDPDGTKV